MSSLLHRLATIVFHVVIVAACFLGVRFSLLFLRADHLFHEDTETSVRSAILLAPDNSEYYMRLAQFARAHSRDLLATALRLNRYNAQGYIELGLIDEADGDFAEAEKMLLAAFAVDHTYLARWTLANYYFRRNDLPEFWKWARSAAEIPTDDIGPLFELCWRVSPDAERIAIAILRANPAVIHQYLEFLLAKDQLHAVALVTPQLIHYGDPSSDLPLLFSLVNRLVAANDATAANTLWTLLIGQHWIAADKIAPNNGNFMREPLPVSFDWFLPEYPGLHSWPAPTGLEVEFSGNEPEDSTIAEQTMTLLPGSYTMSYAYRTLDIPPSTGIQWKIIDTKSNIILLTSPDLSSDTLTHVTLPFSVPPRSYLLRLQLSYLRTLGTPRISGTLVVRSIHIEPHH
jgi:tetratricopeptide (TPR) repeat protein